MSAEEELKTFKLQMLKKSRMQSVVLGIGAVITVLFMIYGFTQNIEAGKQRDITMGAEREAAALREQLIKCESERSKK